MRSIKFIMNVTGSVFIVLFFGSMTLLMTGVTHMHDNAKSADAVITGAVALGCSLLFGAVYVWCERQLTRMMRRELNQQGVPFRMM